MPWAGRIPAVAAAIAAAVAAAVPVLPQPSHPLIWQPVTAPAASHSADTGLLPTAGGAGSSVLQACSHPPLSSNSTACSDLTVDGSPSTHGEQLVAGPAASVAGGGGCLHGSAAAQGVPRWDPPAQHAGAAGPHAVPARGPGRSSGRPNLVSDIEALRERWASACDPHPQGPKGRDIRPGALIDDPGRPPSGLRFGPLRSGECPAWAALTNDRRRGGGSRATHRLSGSLAPAGARRVFSRALRGSDLRHSYPGEGTHPSVCVYARRLCAFNEADACVCGRL